MRRKGQTEPRYNIPHRGGVVAGCQSEHNLQHKERGHPQKTLQTWNGPSETQTAG